MNQASHQQIILRISEANNLCRLALYELNDDNYEQVEFLTTLLNPKLANRKGKQLASEKGILYIKSVKSSKLTESLALQLNRVKKTQKETKRKLWQEAQDSRWSLWASKYPSESKATANAIWTMNRWVKNLGKIEPAYELSPMTGKLVEYKVYEQGMERVWVKTAYQIKNAWIKSNQAFLRSGKKVRHESSWDGGKWQRRWLYCHKFEIEGQEFIFHSYIKPSILESELAEDFPPFRSRKPLSAEEITQIEKNCGISTPDALIEMLGWKILAKKPW